MLPSTITFKSGFRSQCHTKWYATSCSPFNHLYFLITTKIVTLDRLPLQIMELSAMEMEAPEISFEELLAKEKEDTAFWQPNGKPRSASTKSDARS